MSDQRTGGSGRQVLVMVVILAAGGYFYFNRYHGENINQAGLFGGISATPVGYAEDPFVDPRRFSDVVPNADALAVLVGTDSDQLPAGGPSTESLRPDGLTADQRSSRRPSIADSTAAGKPAFDPRTASSPSDRLVGLRDLSASRADGPFPIRHGAYKNITIGSWALDGFGPTKLANQDVRRHIAKIVRRFDLLAIQQVASIERDVIPRLVDEINRGENVYDFIIGESTGPAGRGEQLAFIYNTTRVEVDRRGSYTVADPDNRYVYDPLVIWARAVDPPADKAWTFSLVNVRIDLTAAASEVADLRGLIDAVAADGRGEDDVIIAGLLQADDAYLGPSLGDNTRLAVRHRSTDIYDRYQTCNIVIDGSLTTEFLGRGGVYDFARHHGLNQNEAEAITSHLPLHAEFTAHEGGHL